MQAPKHTFHEEAILPSARDLGTTGEVKTPTALGPASIDGGALSLASCVYSDRALLLQQQSELCKAERVCRRVSGTALMAVSKVGPKPAHTHTHTD